MEQYDGLNKDNGGDFIPDEEFLPDASVNATTSTRAKLRRPTNHFPTVAQSPQPSQLPSGNELCFKRVPNTAGRLTLQSAIHHPSFYESSVQLRDTPSPTIGIEELGLSNQPSMPSAKAKHHAPQLTAQNSSSTPRQLVHEHCAAVSCSPAMDRSVSDLTQNLPKEAPKLLPNTDTTTKHFQDAYTEQTRGIKERVDRNNQYLQYQASASHTQKQRPAVERAMQSPQSWRPRQVAPAIGNFKHPVAKAVASSADSDNNMSSPNEPSREIAVHLQKIQFKTGKKSNNKRARLEIPGPSAGQSGDTSPDITSQSTTQELLDLLVDPILPSKIYMKQLRELRAVLKEDEEKLERNKNHKDARDMELQILLLRTDIEKTTTLLKAQLAYDEMSDGEGGCVAFNLARPYDTPVSDGSCGLLPRPSVFMLKMLNKLRAELQNLDVEMGGKKGKQNYRGMEDKMVRMQNLRSFIAEFERYFKEDYEREEKFRRLRGELQQQAPSSTKHILEAPIRFPTQMIHSPPKEPPRDISTQLPSRTNDSPAGDDSDRLRARPHRGNPHKSPIAAEEEDEHAWFPS
ncbi:hypothetical protein VP1G_05378 [Cytospora mali]|uniref:Uncharacterized protein n=1 Tax=Cytospora mali TaxID=578113 RepID=A0A194V2J1_CYTMA|nr:hypothetical protein VP1G_05378 [Valsa mali var. pyri (nom. inval.)]